MFLRKKWNRNDIMMAVHCFFPQRWRKPSANMTKQDQQTLQNTGERRVERKLDGQLDAANVQGGEEQGDRRSPSGLVIDQHGDHQAQVSRSRSKSRGSAGDTRRSTWIAPAIPPSAPHRMNAIIMYCQVGTPNR